MTFMWHRNICFIRFIHLHLDIYDESFYTDLMTFYTAVQTNSLSHLPGGQIHY